MVRELETKLLTREPFTFEREVGSGAIIAVYIRPILSGWHVVTYTDITDTKKVKKPFTLQWSVQKKLSCRLVKR